MSLVEDRDYRQLEARITRLEEGLIKVSQGIASTQISAQRFESFERGQAAIQDAMNKLSIQQTRMEQYEKSQAELWETMRNFGEKASEGVKRAHGRIDSLGEQVNTLSGKLTNLQTMHEKCPIHEIVHERQSRSGMNYNAIVTALVLLAQAYIAYVLATQ